MKSTSILATLLVSFLLSVPVIAQQSARIAGTVVDKASGEPAFYANIILMRSGEQTTFRGTAADNSGKFVINALPFGVYDLSIRMIGFENYDLDNLRLQPGAAVIDLGSIELKPTVLSLEEVEVTAERSSLQLSLDKKVFVVGKDLTEGGNSAADVLDNVPSVTVDVEGQVSLRGSTNLRILVDGKPSALLGINGSDGLRSLPANMIAQVEVITNPSARYDAEGSAGIINLVLAKQRAHGLNGSFNIPTGWPHNHGASLSANYRRENFNFFISDGVYYRKRPGGGTLYQETFDPVLSILEEERDHTRGGWSNQLRFGSDYYINEQNILTGSLSYSYNNEDNLYDIFYRDSDALRNMLAASQRRDNEGELEKRLEYELNFRRKFGRKGHVLTADMQYDSNYELETNDIFEQPSLITPGIGTQDTLTQAVSNLEKENRYLFQLDYSQPRGEHGNFEFGLKSNLRDLNNDYVSREQDAIGEWRTLSGLTNNLDYTENVHAAYLITGDKMGKFSYQTGLRFEYSDISTHLRLTSERNDRSYFGLFPSLHFTYDLPNENALQISYSRRLRRPRHRQLNPFSGYTDARNIRRGNPNLDPEFTHSTELGHIKHWATASLTGSIYYRESSGVIEYIRFYEDSILVSQPENLSSRQAYGLEFTSDYEVGKALKLDGNLNFYRSQTDGRALNESFTSDSYSWFARLSSKMNLPFDSDLQLRFNYHAPRNTVQGRTKSETYVDLAASKDVFSGNGTLSLSVRDLFNSRRRYSETFAETFYAESEFFWRRRSVRFGFTYRLNQKKRAQRLEEERGEGGPG